ncbi:MAG TPA: hypothetical protein VGR57_21195 [Ktedonobacterales bacterium]|nr:hypothetical protein [Ktedonobacterales bacterium]
MSRSLLSPLLILVAVICLAMTIWYLVPGVYHPLVTHGIVNDRHTTHAILFFVVAVLSAIGSRFVRAR